MSDYRAGSFVCRAAGCDRPKGHISHRMLNIRRRSSTSPGYLSIALAWKTAAALIKGC